MFLVARDLYEMLVLYRRKHATRSSTFGIWSEVREYRAPIHEYTMGQRFAVGRVSRQPAPDVNQVSVSVLKVTVSTTSQVNVYALCAWASEGFFPRGSQQ